MPIDAAELEGRFVELRDEAHYANARTDTVVDAVEALMAEFYEFYGNPYVRRYVREEYLQRLERVFCFGGWDTSDGEDEPEIKEERGGALDEFLDEFKPQTKIGRAHV